MFTFSQPALALVKAGLAHHRRWTRSWMSPGDTSGFTLLGTCVDMVVPPPALTEAWAVRTVEHVVGWTGTGAGRS